MKKKIVLIIGVTGQDGSLLSEFLIKKKNKVIGTTTSNRLSNLKKLNISKKIILIRKKNYNQLFFENILKKYAVDQIYYFTGQSSVSKSEKLNFTTLNSNINPLIDLLEALRRTNSQKIKLLNAVSSEMFGNTKKKINEITKLNPSSFYGLAKCINFEMSKSYRSQFGLNIVNLILFNHESFLRPEHFILKKLVNGIKSIKSKKTKKIELGNINIKRDWGWAPEYIKFMYKIANSNYSDDFVIATGKTIKLSKIIKKLFKKNNLSISKNIKISKKYFRKNEINENYADISKTKRIFNFKPKYSISKILETI